MSRVRMFTRQTECVGAGSLVSTIPGRQVDGSFSGVHYAWMVFGQSFLCNMISYCWMSARCFWFARDARRTEGSGNRQLLEP